MNTLRRLAELAGARRWRAALAVVLGTAAIAFGVGLMATAGYLISRAAEQPPILSLTVAIVAVRFFGIGRPLVRYLERLASHDLAFRTLGRLRVWFYTRLEPLSPAETGLYRKGDLLNRFVADVDAQQNLYLRGLIPPLVALTTGAIAVGVALTFLPAAGLVLAVGLLVAGLAVPVFAAALSRASTSRQAEARADLTAELVELLDGAQELVAYGREKEALERVGRNDAQLASLARRDALVGGLAESLGALVAGFTLIGVLIVAITAENAGSLDRVLVAMLALLAVASFEAVAALPGAARDTVATSAAGDRLFEVADREPVVRDPDASLPAPPPRPSVALEGVSATYDRDGALALDEFDLRLEPGRRVALVGPSGAGKTTVTNLLLRFLDPVAGRVTLDGRDLRAYAQRDVRNTISVAGQEAHVFATSIRENVRLADPSASDDAIEAALQRAGLWDWVCSLPDRVDTLVGEGGRELSGGQRQRLTLARALLRDAPVLVLDEPTAQLDPPTAQALMEDVIAAADGRSLLLITHRPEGLDAVDEVVVLEGGRND